MKPFQIAIKKKKMGCIEAKNNCSCGRKISIKMNGSLNILEEEEVLPSSEKIICIINFEF